MYADWEAVRRGRGWGFWSVIGRLKPNVTLEQAQAEMGAIARRLDEQLPPAARNRGISVVPLSLHVTGPMTRLALWMLTGAVFLVLLIAATNVASLSLEKRLPIGQRVEGLLVAADGRHVYAAAQAENKVVKVSLADWRPVLEIKTAERPDPMLLLPNDARDTRARP